MTTTMAHCGVCLSELRVTAMTAAGVTMKCDCGRTTMTRLAEGELPMSERVALDDCLERPGCTSSLHLSTCPESGRRC